MRSFSAMQLSNESGFSLVEVMIAMFLLMLVAYGYANQAILQSKMSRTAESKMAVSDLRTSIAIALSQEPVCLASLGGKTIGATLSVLHSGYRDHDASGAPWVITEAYRTGAANATPEGLIIESMEIAGSLSPGNTGPLVIRMRLVQKKEVIGPAGVLRDISIRATLDSTGQITECRAYPGGVDTQSIVCEDTATQCANANDYCTGEIFPNPTGGCLCRGTRTTGMNVNSFVCGASPTP